MPKKIPETTLTPEQIKRRERNKRYRLKLVQEGETQKPSPIKEKTKYNAFHTLNKLPDILLLTAITSLLIFFQAQTYLEDAMNPWLAWSIAIVCEASLCYLSFSLRRSLVSCLLFASLFIYTLGTMTYGIKKDEAIKTGEIESHTVIKESLDRAQAGFDLALSKKESGSMAKYMKTIEALSDDLTKTPSVGAGIVQFQSYWIIALRAILMLINATLVHRMMKCS